jgi:hypothetical protein
MAIYPFGKNVCPSDSTHWVAAERLNSEALHIAKEHEGTYVFAWMKFPTSLSHDNTTDICMLACLKLGRMHGHVSHGQFNPVGTAAARMPVQA